MYAVVKFLDENDAVGIICCKWMYQEDMCMYPIVKTNEARDRLLRDRANPKQSWTSCKIEVLHQYKTLRAALEQLRTAEYSSNLESESESIIGPRKRIKKVLRYPGEDSDEEVPPSQKNKKVDHLPYPVPPKDFPTIHLPTSLSSSLSSSSPESTGLGCQQVASQIERPSQVLQSQSQLFSPSPISSVPALQSQLFSPSSSLAALQSQLFSPSSSFPNLQSQLFSPSASSAFPGIAQQVNSEHERPSQD